MSPRYPDAAASALVNRWTAETATGRVSYEVLASGATLAKAGAVCENHRCKIGAEAGRTVNGAVESVGWLTCTGPGTSWSEQAWTLSATCAATDQERPEITHVRGVVTSEYGGRLASVWQVVSDPYPAAQVQLSGIGYSADIDTGRVSYDVTVSAKTLAKASGLCENSSCNIRVEAGRADAGGAVQSRWQLSCTGPGASSWNDRPWTLTANCAATDQQREETTHIRGIVQNQAGGSITSGWQVVSAPFPAERVELSDVNYAADTQTGKITYDLKVKAATLAKTGGLCETRSCYITVEAGRLINGAVQGVSSLSCAGPATSWTTTPWTLAATCAATGQQRPEITHIRGAVHGENGGSVTSAWQLVNDPYPDAQVQLSDVGYSADTHTGRVTYDLKVSATALAKANGLCETRSCYIAVEAGRDNNGTVQGVSSLSCTGPATSWTSSPWTLAATCAATDQPQPEITHIRGVVHAENGQRVTSAWQVVHAPYPAERVELSDIDYAADTDTGKITYDLKVGGATLAKAGGLCETRHCYVAVEAGRNIHGVVQGVATLTCTGPAASWTATPWSLVSTCTATDQQRPEITHIRGVVHAENGRSVTSAWQLVQMPYDDPSVSVDSFYYDIDTVAGTATYTAAASARTLAAAGDPCETASCRIGIELGGTATGSVNVVGSVTCGPPAGDWQAMPWTLAADCTSTSSITTNVTRVRAVVYSSNGRTVASDWMIVGPKSATRPGVALEVTKWENLSEADGHKAFEDIKDRDGGEAWQGEAGSNAGFVDYDITARAFGLNTVGGPCEVSFCSLVFEGGMPDAAGIIRATSRIAVQAGTSNAVPGTAENTISAEGERVGVVDQLYLRASVYSHDRLSLTSGWQAKSSLTYRADDPDLDMDVLWATGVAAAIQKNPAPDSIRYECGVWNDIRRSPKFTPTSTNDVTNYCMIARAAGRGFTRITDDIRRIWGPSAVTTAAFVLLQDSGLSTEPQQFRTAEEEESEFLTSLSVLKARPRVKHRLALDMDDDTAARKLLLQCKDVLGSTKACEERPIWSPARDVRAASEHIYSAIKDFQKPAQSTYISSAELGLDLPAGWYKRAEFREQVDGRANPCAGPTSPDACDEYPFRTSEEAGTLTKGVNAHLQVINSADNSLEGSLRWTFLTQCRIPQAAKGTEGRKFLVIPLPDVESSIGWCRN